MYRRLLLSAFLLIFALVLVSVRLYQRSRSLDMYRQDLQALSKLMDLSTPAIQHYNYIIQKEQMMISMAYRSQPGDAIARRFRRLDSLGQECAAWCASADGLNLSRIVHAYADSVLTYTDGDSLVSDLLRGALWSGVYRDKYADTILRKQAIFQLGLLQSIGVNHLAARFAVCGGMYFSENDPVLIPRRMVARVGQPFEAQLFLVHRAPVNFQVEASINGQKCPLLEGTGAYNTVFHQSGLQKLNIKVITINPFTGEVHTSGRIQEVLVTN